FLARRNAISMLMSIELMLNAVNLSIVAFGAFIPALQNQASVIALLVIAAADGLPAADHAHPDPAAGGLRVQRARGAPAAGRVRHPRGEPRPGARDRG